ncbi:unnamed protein product [Sympodiomycopsis kandeliae]
MLSSFTLLLASVLALVQVGQSFSLQSRQYQDPNSPLLVDYPSCAYYKCIVTWQHGQSTHINWINAPDGQVQLDLMTNDNNDVAYPIANVSSPSQPGYCDAGEGVGVVVKGKQCGQFAFIVPTEWTPGRNYSVRALLQGNPSIESYTDVVQIKAAEGNPEPNIPLSTVAISGAPTSTDGSNNGGSGYTGSTTAPTSPGATNAPTPTSSAAASSQGNNKTASSASGSSPSGTSSASSSNTNAAISQLQLPGTYAVLTLGAIIFGGAFLPLTF